MRKAQFHKGNFSQSRSKMLLIGFVFILAYVTAFAMFPAFAWASGNPASTETLIAGPYIIDVNLYQDPPVTDQSSEITVVPHEENLRLTGRILMVPGLGTDAVELHSNLVPQNQASTLVGTLRMPVRGAWQIVIQLNGPRGAGEASFPVRVAGPGAMPYWLAWLIALTPLVGIAWMIWHQRRYRKRLLLQSHHL
jgi:hypothetical protein